MIVEFYLKGNKLYKQDSEQTINQNATDIILSFDLKEEWKDYKVYCLVKTKEFVYRLELHKKDDKLTCDLPNEASSFAFIKLSLYGVGKEDRVTSNELIIPIDRGGYLEYKPHKKHDIFHHHGKHHYHHDFPHHYPPVKTEKPPHHNHPNHKKPAEYHEPFDVDEINKGIPKPPIHPPHKPPFMWKKGDKAHMYHHKSHDMHPNHKRPYYEVLGDKTWDDSHVDIFDFVLNEIKESINYILIDDDKCYAYHNDKLLQVIPLPDYVTKEELKYFFGDLISDINFFENGDVIITRGTFGD